MNQLKEIKRLEVVEIESGMTVKELNVAGRSAGEVQKISDGLLRNMDTYKFFVREVEDTK